MEPNSPISGLTADQIEEQTRRNYRNYDRSDGQSAQSAPSDRQFLEVNGVVVNADHIVDVDFTKDGLATMHMSSGNCRSFAGEDAAALRRFFAPQNTAPPPAAPPDYRPGYRPALAEALPAGVETVRYADGTSATGVAPLPRVSVNGAPAVGDEEAPAPDGGQAGKPVPLTEHQVWEK
jgi:hypothetical protein